MGDSLQTVKELLEEGIRLAEAGKKQDAKSKLARAIQLDATLIDGWWWLAQCLDVSDQQAICLKQVLKLDPRHEGARALLLKIEGGEHPQVSSIENDRAPDESSTANDRSVSPSQSPEKVPPVSQSGSRKYLVVLGASVSIALFVLTIVWLNSQGIFNNLWDSISGRNLNFQGIASPMGTRTLPQKWTATPSSDPSPTKPLVVATDAVQASRIEEAFESFEQAKLLMEEKKFDQVVALLNRSIELDPNFADAYYYRGWSHIELSKDQLILSEFLENTYKAIDDLDRAIKLEPTLTGDYYLKRAVAYERLAYIQDLRVDREQYIAIALENLRQGISLINTRPHSERIEAYFLTFLGQCDESLHRTQEIIKARGIDAAPSGFLTQQLAYVDVCNGNYAQALQKYEIVNEYIGSVYTQYDQALILYILGHVDQALEIIDEMIEVHPNFLGWRYYLRALIHLDRGDIDKAQADLQTGWGYTWDHTGIAQYVLAQLAFHEGDTEFGIESLKMAEATMDRVLGDYFIEKWRQELAAMGESPLEPISTVDFYPTPIPAFDSNLPAESRPPRRITIWMDESTGPLVIAPGEKVDIQVVPRSDYLAIIVEELSIFLGWESLDQPIDARIMIPHKENQMMWANVQAQWGDNPIIDPQMYIHKAGDVYIRLWNTSELPLHLKDVGVRVMVLTPGGEHITYSMEPFDSP
jgi:tetratricopeptide (TPR) repeat protein